MNRIRLNALQKIIREELKRKLVLEGEQHKAALDHADAAVKCLDALEKYKEVASEPAMAEFGDSLERVEQILTRIATSPLNYVDANAVEDETSEDGMDLTAPPTGKSPASKKSVKPNVVKGSSGSAL